MLYAKYKKRAILEIIGRVCGGWPIAASVGSGEVEERISLPCEITLGVALRAFHRVDKFRAAVDFVACAKNRWVARSVLFREAYPSDHPGHRVGHREGSREGVVRPQRAPSFLAEQNKTEREASPKKIPCRQLADRGFLAISDQRLLSNDRLAPDDTRLSAAAPSCGTTPDRPDAAYSSISRPVTDCG